MAHYSPQFNLTFLHGRPLSLTSSPVLNAQAAELGGKNDRWVPKQVSGRRKFVPSGRAVETNQDPESPEEVARRYGTRPRLTAAAIAGPARRRPKRVHGPPGGPPFFPPSPQSLSVPRLRREHRNPGMSGPVPSGNSPARPPAVAVATPLSALAPLALGCQPRPAPYCACSPARPAHTAHACRPRPGHTTLRMLTGLRPRRASASRSRDSSPCRGHPFHLPSSVSPGLLSSPSQALLVGSHGIPCLHCHLLHVVSPGGPLCWAPGCMAVVKVWRAESSGPRLQQFQSKFRASLNFEDISGILWEEMDNYIKLYLSISNNLKKSIIGHRKLFEFSFCFVEFH
ncbi:uncharacterized protein LOC117073370 [Trachypithecus francoisi]|uniref:uncharacterized protein LOC117073370 n=1 Tax=Trachypithecus francoisi TaxID=54180 RepID=UPI00141A9BE8|nr:uncharacterized protein LOC117073370 [Trachypithecus francoisi]